MYVCKNFVKNFVLIRILKDLHLKNLPKGDIIVVSESFAKIGECEYEARKILWWPYLR